MFLKPLGASKSSDTNFNYRPDIDGLRGIAVLLVVLYHAFPKIVPAGYLGVDIFFVISGYLITQNIVLNCHNIKDLQKFYVRRIRRIFPSLVVVLMAVLFFGWFLFLAMDYRQLSKHVAGATTFTSNFLFWRESGYFDNASETKPLLHLWSLAVEEQFYLIFPLFIVTLRRIRLNNYLTQILYVATLSSFTFYIFLAQENMTAAFYSPLSRFWQLLAGSLIATSKFRGLSTQKLSRNGRNSVFIITAFLILMVAIPLNESRVKNQVVWSLLPVIASVLIISNQSTKLTSKILENKYLISVGLISYPLYLWHWPLLTFPRVITGATSPTIVIFILLLLSIVLSILTHKFIETPLRYALAPGVALSVLGGLTASLFISSVIIFFNNGLTSRAIEQQAIIFSGDIGHDYFHGYISEEFYPCTPSLIFQNSLSWNGNTRCNQSKENAPISFLLFGDSHAEHLFIGIAEVLPNENVGFYIHDGPPINSDTRFSNFLDEAIQNKYVKTVLISYSWSSYDFDLKQIDELILKLHLAKKEVYITDGSPTFSFEPKYCKYQGKCEELNAVASGTSRSYSSELESIAKKYEWLNFVKTNSYICTKSTCSMTTGSDLLYRDNNHLNVKGSKFIGKLILGDFPNLLVSK